MSPRAKNVVTWVPICVSMAWTWNLNRFFLWMGCDDFTYSQIDAANFYDQIYASTASHPPDLFLIIISCMKEEIWANAQTDKNPGLECAWRSDNASALKIFRASMQVAKLGDITKQVIRMDVVAEKMLLWFCWVGCGFLNIYFLVNFMPRTSWAASRVNLYPIVARQRCTLV